MLSDVPPLHQRPGYSTKIGDERWVNIILRFDPSLEARRTIGDDLMSNHAESG